MRRNPEQRKEFFPSETVLRDGIRKIKDPKCGSCITLRFIRVRAYVYFLYPTGPKRIYGSTYKERIFR